MLEFLRNHFSFTTPASVHDEEALTALELAGRQSAKINEVVKDQNDLRSETEEHLASQDKDMNVFKTDVKTNVIPSEVDKSVRNYINKGTFGEAVNDHYTQIERDYATLESRVNELLGTVTEGSTTGDAELIDARTDYAGQNYTNVGEAIRTVTEAIFKRHRNWVVGATGYTKFNIDTVGKCIDISGGSPCAMYSDNSYAVITGACDYAEVWGDRTSGASFYLMYDRTEGALKLVELDLNYPSEITGDNFIIATILIKNDGSILHVGCCEDLKRVATVNNVKILEESTGSGCECDPVQIGMDEFKSAMIFENVMCIGDSFTSGHIETSDGNYVESNPNFSYPYYMSKILGTNFINAGVSGFRISDMWNTDETASSRYSQITSIINESGETPNAYLIGVGLNDFNNTTVGTNTDTVDSQTFMGGLYSLLNDLKTLNPKAHIFVQIPPDIETSGEWHTAFVQTVGRLSGGLYDNKVHILDLSMYKERYQTSKITNSKVGNHYTAVGYQQFAQNLVYIWSQYINQCYYYFLEVHNPVPPVDYESLLYEHFGVDKTEYPVVYMYHTPTWLRVGFAAGVSNITSTSFTIEYPEIGKELSNTSNGVSNPTTENVYNACIQKLSSKDFVGRNYNTTATPTDDERYWINDYSVGTYNGNVTHI